MTEIIEYSQHPAGTPEPMENKKIKSVLEAALLSADAPLSVNELKRLFSNKVGKAAIEEQLENLCGEMKKRPVELVEVATGWRFQTRPEFAEFIDRLSPEKAPKYSRAVMETLAIVAYRQPVTRGDIEEIRGVSVSSQIVKTLEDRGWIDVIGHKEVIGRPALFGTTNQFLDDLGLNALTELPSIDDLASNDETVEMLTQNLVELSPPQDGATQDLQTEDDAADGDQADVDQIDDEQTQNQEAVLETEDGQGEEPPADISADTDKG